MYPDVDLLKQNISQEYQEISENRDIMGNSLIPYVIEGLDCVPMLNSHSARVVLQSSRGRKGISPVIATVILVAIAVVLVASLSGSASSLLGTYSYSPQISVESLEINNDGTGRILVYNAGARSDSLVALQVFPNSPMSMVTDDGWGRDAANGSDPEHDNNGNNSSPSPRCKEHSAEGNCMHDQDQGKSGSSSRNQNEPNGGNSNNSGGQSDGANGNGGNNNGHRGKLLPPYAETDLSWTEASVGNFSTGDIITVQVYLESGNRLTISTIVS